MGTTTFCCFILAWTYAFVFGTVLVSVSRMLWTCHNSGEIWLQSIVFQVGPSFCVLGPFVRDAGARSALVFSCSCELIEDPPWLWMYVLWGSGGRRVRVAGRVLAPCSLARCCFGVGLGCGRLLFGVLRLALVDPEPGCHAVRLMRTSRVVHCELAQ
jgi:hypothetical protein